MSGAGCPKCSHYVSTQENETADFLNQYIELRQSDKKVLQGKELDIFIPSKNLAIEFNGLYWHSELYKSNNYHLDKLESCVKQGIKLIHIFEDEWRDNQDIVKSRLLNLLGVTPNKIFARNCVIKEVSSKDSTVFLEQNHIQGKLGASVRLGLYHNNELVSLMTFGNLRKNLGSTSEKGSYELLRFCNKLNTTVVGGASRLLKYFENNYQPKEVISYADLRWSDGNLYETLNFKKVSQSSPNYFYTKGRIRENRFKYRKSELVKQGFDVNKSERQIMQELGYYRIYDCGALKYVKEYL